MMSNQQKGTKGDFANDPKRAFKAGKKGGEQSHDRQHDQEDESGCTQQGGGNIANDPKRAFDAGNKGGPRRPNRSSHIAGSDRCMRNIPPAGGNRHQARRPSPATSCGGLA
jgi:uncharacterized protein